MTSGNVIDFFAAREAIMVKRFIDQNDEVVYEARYGGFIVPPGFKLTPVTKAERRREVLFYIGDVDVYQLPKNTGLTFGCGFCHNPAAYMVPSVCPNHYPCYERMILLCLHCAGARSCNCERCATARKHGCGRRTYR